MFHITVYNDQTGVSESHPLTQDFLAGLPKTEKAALKENEKVHAGKLAAKNGRGEETAAETNG